jgi:hypothetical protein
VHELSPRGQVAEGEEAGHVGADRGSSCRR